MSRSALATLDVSFSTLEGVVLLDRKAREELASTTDGSVGDDQPALTLLVLSASSSKTMDVRLTVSRSVHLDDMGDVGEIHSTSRDI